MRSVAYSDCIHLQDQDFSVKDQDKDCNITAGVRRPS